ncbi:hypothetical protein BJX68DRAFT_273009 [Aspergillus pseudodeflectus]|uniref:LysM domain-containing protein n=1 Tax=Aspergillus pseudodeflectus TaxID=176178 RepID=A0ABR4JCZ9_9EURO
MSIPTLLPMAPGTRKDCFLYAEGADMQCDIAGTIFSLICHLMAEGWDLSLSELGILNPSLNTSSKACAPDPQYQYCMQLLDGVFTPSPTPTSSLTPTPGLPIRVLTEFGMTMAEFYSWNPAVGPDCAGLWLDYQYCIHGPSSTSTPSPTPPALPIRDGAIEGCQQYEPIVAPTTCQSFLDEYDISMAEFYAWNPAVGSQCQGLWPDYRYCVRGPPTTSSSSTEPTQTPLPIRDGAITGCQAYAAVVAPMTCQSVLSENGITMAQFYSWNPAVGPQCTGLWHGKTPAYRLSTSEHRRLTGAIVLDYRYCVRGL